MGRQAGGSVDPCAAIPRPDAPEHLARHPRTGHRRRSAPRRRRQGEDGSSPWALAERSGRTGARSPPPRGAPRRQIPPPSVGPLDREPCTHSAYPRSEALHSGRSPSAHPTRETHHVPRNGRYPVRPSAVSRRYARRGHRPEQDDGIVPTRILTNGMMNRNNNHSILEKSCAKVTKIPTFYQHVVPSFAHSSARRHARTAPFAVARAARK